MDSNLSVRYSTNPITTILFIASIIGKWKIFSDNGEGGWKSLIPLLSTYTFSKVADETKIGKKLVLSYIALWVTGIIAVVALSASLVAYSTPEEIQYIIDQGAAGETLLIDLTSQMSSLSLPFLIAGILFLVAAVASIVYFIKLHYRYTIKRGAESWWIIIWIFLPAVGYLYFAFANPNKNEEI